MKEIVLSGGLVATVDDCDYDALSQISWSAKRTKCGIYASSSKDPSTYMHRLICQTDHDVDHIDGNGLNNTRANLRPATRSQNLANMRKPKGPATSRFKGVYREKKSGRFRVRLGVNRKVLSFGSYENEIEAALAYDRAARKHFGEFARTNL